MSVALTADEFFERARSQKDLGIRYKLGGGASRAARDSCADASNTCDCSAFVCWALGIDKQRSYPYLVPPSQVVEPGNQWYGTDNMWNDAVHLEVGLFQRISEPHAGCVVVFPARRTASGKSTPGHVGVVTRAGTTGVEAVLHCSSSNFKATGDAIQETDEAVFRDRPGLIYAWCAQIPTQHRRTPVKRAAAEMPVTLPKPVVLCVLAAGTEGARVRKVAEKVASDNPLGRCIVGPGDRDSPARNDIRSWTENADSPAAVVLSPGGSVFALLGTAKAKNATAIDRAFSDAAVSPRVRTPERGAKRVRQTDRQRNDESRPVRAAARVEKRPQR